MKQYLKLFMPIIVAILTWGLARIKNPDYSITDWKCKQDKSSFEKYSYFLAIMILYPVIVYVLSYAVWEGVIKPILELCNINQYTKLIGCLCDIVIIFFVYAITFRVMFACKGIFKTSETEKETKKLNIMVFLPIALDLVHNILIFIINDGPYYLNIFLIGIIIFQLIGVSFFDTEKKCQNKKVKIITEKYGTIIASAEFVSKRGKWLSILEKEKQCKERLILFDDVKSFEYYDE